MINYSNQIDELINAQCNVIEIVTYEWQRLYKSIAISSSNQQRQFIIYSPTSGLKIYGSNLDISTIYNDVEIKSFLDVLAFFNERAKNATLLIEDAEQFLDPKHFDNIRYIKEIAKNTSCKHSKMNKTLILSTTSVCIPNTLAKEISLINIPFVQRDEMEDLFNEISIELRNDYPKAKIFYEELIGESLLGLSTSEINHVLRKILNEHGQITLKELPYFLKEKSKAITSNSLLELISPEIGLNEVGGLATLKHWVKYRKYAFSKRAKQYGLQTPKGIMLLGIPGCGKSLVAKAVAHDWNYPLLKLDFGRLYHRYLGDSEANLRQAISIAETMSPCILWVDEIEKGLAGAGRSDDSGTASRLFGTFLTWMQEKKSPVFIIATANHIEQIPVELFRKGRFDEIFFLDLPNKEERYSIIDIHLSQKQQFDKSIDIEELANLSHNFTGSEIECAINDALFEAFQHKEVYLTQPYLVKAFKATNPLANSMKDNIDSIRIWGANTIKSAR